MSAVRGGDNGNSATNTIGQVLNLSVPVAVGAGGPRTPTSRRWLQYATIFNDQDAGDSFRTLFPYAAVFANRLLPPPSNFLENFK